MQHGAPIRIGAANSSFSDFHRRATRSRSMLGDAHRSRRCRHDRLSERSFSSRCQISRARTKPLWPGDGSGIVFYGRAEASIPHRPMRCESNLARSNLWKRSNPGKSSSSRIKAIIAASIAPHSTAPLDIGGARRDRTDDLLLAKQALSQLSYGPSRAGTARAFPTTDFRSLIPETGGPGKT